MMFTGIPRSRLDVPTARYARHVQCEKNFVWQLSETRSGDYKVKTTFHGSWGQRCCVGSCARYDSV